MVFCLSAPSQVPLYITGKPFIFSNDNVMYTISVMFVSNTSVVPVKAILAPPLQPYPNHVRFGFSESYFKYPGESRRYDVVCVESRPGVLYGEGDVLGVNKLLYAAELPVSGVLRLGVY